MEYFGKFVKIIGGIVVVLGLLALFGWWVDRPPEKPELPEGTDKYTGVFAKVYCNSREKGAPRIAWKKIPCNHPLFEGRSNEHAKYEWHNLCFYDEKHTGLITAKGECLKIPNDKKTKNLDYKFLSYLRRDFLAWEDNKLVVTETRTDVYDYIWSGARNMSTFTFVAMWVVFPFIGFLIATGNRVGQSSLYDLDPGERATSDLLALVGISVSLAIIAIGGEKSAAIIEIMTTHVQELQVWLDTKRIEGTNSYLPIPAALDIYEVQVPFFLPTIFYHLFTLILFACLGWFLVNWLGSFKAIVTGSLHVFVPSKHEKGYSGSSGFTPPSFNDIYVYLVSPFKRMWTDNQTRKHGIVTEEIKSKTAEHDMEHELLKAEEEARKLKAKTRAKNDKGAANE